MTDVLQEENVDEALAIPWCSSCARTFWYPRERCPRCMSSEVRLLPTSGAGEIYSYTIERRGLGRGANDVPYAIAWIDLDAGVRVMARMSSGDFEALCVGTPVRVGRAFRGALQFTPS